jgi:hypothetical protein
VTLDEHLAGRLPERVELTAYYVSRPARSLTGWSGLLTPDASEDRLTLYVGLESFEHLLPVPAELLGLGFICAAVLSQGQAGDVADGG